jgi:hypothetical protein
MDFIEESSRISNTSCGLGDFGGAGVATAGAADATGAALEVVVGTAPRAAAAGHAVGLAAAFWDA